MACSGSRFRGVKLAGVCLLAACGGRDGLLLGGPPNAAQSGAGSGGSAGAHVGSGGASSAGAPFQAGAPAQGGAAPIAGAPSGGAGAGGEPSGGTSGGATAGAGGSAPVKCMSDATNCPNGFVCAASGFCETRCESSQQCRPDHFCAVGNAVCPSKALQIAAGVSDTCVVVADGSVHCWGDGDAGQLGDGVQMSSTPPVTVEPIPGGNAGLKQLSLGNSFSCAVTLDGSGSCWGAGDLGQLGIGTLNPSPVPVALAGLAPMTDRLISIGAGRFHACAVTAAGKVLCWGANFTGQLGDNTQTSRTSPAPTVPPYLPQAERVVSGDAHACALLGAHQPGAQVVMCWGSDQFGQLGWGKHTDSSTPVAVPGATIPGDVIVDISSGANHTCTLYQSGDLRCWGDNSEMQVGLGAPFNAYEPVLVQGLPIGEQPLALSAGRRNTCVLTDQHSVTCWGRGAASGAATETTPPTRVYGFPTDDVPIAIAAGESHGCAITQSGSVRCWGSNNDGALGSPGFDSAISAVAVLPW